MTNFMLRRMVVRLSGRRRIGPVFLPVKQTLLLLLQHQNIEASFDLST